MRQFIFLFQLLERDMRINLGRRQTFMPQKLFHRLKVGAVVEHCGGKAVAQDVGTAFLQHDDTPELRFNQIVYKV